ncbi:mitochondrial ribosomal protein L12 isoform X2 [Ptiloglossa arizonensis]
MEAVAAVDKSVVPPSTVTNKELEIGSKVNQIADQIVTLNLLEVAQLSEVLKKRLNLPDAPLVATSSLNLAPKIEEEEQAPQVVQSAFTIKLVSFDAKQKVGLIKEIKNILPDCNLVQAKKFVENAPVIIKTDIPKEEAEQMKKSIENVGGTVKIE